MQWLFFRSTDFTPPASESPHRSEKFNFYTTLRATPVDWEKKSGGSDRDGELPLPPQSHATTRGARKEEEEGCCVKRGPPGGARATRSIVGRTRGLYLALSLCLPFTESRVCGYGREREKGQRADTMSGNSDLFSL